MIFDVSQVGKACNNHPKERVNSTALALVGTAQFIEARRSEYLFFDKEDIRLRAAAIIQMQAYLLYCWCLFRFILNHPLSLHYINPEYYKILPFNFIPSNKDIELYLSDPKFLFRFSLANYAFFSRCFGSKLPLYSCNIYYVGACVSYMEDTSPLLPYITTLTDSVKNKLKHKLKKTSIESFKPINFNRIVQLEIKFTSFKLDDYIKSEYMYSDDFDLHQMDPDFDYDDFLFTIITGYTRRGAGNLILQKIKSNNLKKIAKKERKKLTKQLKNEKVSRNHNKIQINYESPTSSIRSTIKSKLNIITTNLKKPKTSEQILKANVDDMKLKDIFSDNDSSIDEYIKFPNSALQYMGESTIPHKFVRRQHLLKLASDRRKLIKPSNIYSENTNWNHNILLKKKSNSGNLYRIALKYFGDNCNVNEFVSSDNEGNKVRIGWKLSCNEKIEKKFLSKYFHGNNNCFNSSESSPINNLNSFPEHQITKNLYYNNFNQKLSKPSLKLINTQQVYNESDKNNMKKTIKIVKCVLDKLPTTSLNNENFNYNKFHDENNLTISSSMKHSSNYQNQNKTNNNNNLNSAITEVNTGSIELKIINSYNKTSNENTVSLAFINSPIPNKTDANLTNPNYSIEDIPYQNPKTDSNYDVSKDPDLNTSNALCVNEYHHCDGIFSTYLSENHYKSKNVEDEINEYFGFISTLKCLEDVEKKVNDFSKWFNKNAFTREFNLKSLEKSLYIMNEFSTSMAEYSEDVLFVAESSSSVYTTTRGSDIKSLDRSETQKAYLDGCLQRYINMLELFD